MQPKCSDETCAGMDRAGCEDRTDAGGRLVDVVELPLQILMGGSSGLIWRQPNATNPVHSGFHGVFFSWYYRSR